MNLLFKNLGLSRTRATLLYHLFGAIQCRIEMAKYQNLDIVSTDDELVKAAKV